jgi:hypothetical protein
MHERPQTYVDVLADFVGIPKFTLAKAEMRYVNSSGTLTVPRSYHVTRAASYLAIGQTKKLVVLPRFAICSAGFCSLRVTSMNRHRSSHRSCTTL